MIRDEAVIHVIGVPIRIPCAERIQAADLDPVILSDQSHVLNGKTGCRDPGYLLWLNSKFMETCQPSSFYLVREGQVEDIRKRHGVCQAGRQVFYSVRHPCVST
ncbi:hypothetical protein D3C80_1276520 [compost metagenome]